jgi:hypothetical protein
MKRRILRQLPEPFHRGLHWQFDIQALRHGGRIAAAVANFQQFLGLTLQK